MPPERYPKDMVLTAEDFACCGWKEILKRAPPPANRLQTAPFHNVNGLSS